jgi:S-formylglutathione hydrolase FrmB
MNRSGRFAAAVAAIIFGLLSFCKPAQASLGRMECRSAPSKILHHAVRYCAILPPSYDSEKMRRYPVLYFLHGLGGNEQLLVGSGGWNIVEDLWEQHKIGEFLIVTPNADTSFYINSRDGRERYEDFFLREFIPFIEKTYRTVAERGARGIGGISMGGYGALHIAFGHPQLFVSVTANSAALLAKFPNVRFANPQESPLLRALRPFGTPPDEGFWHRNDPLTLARTANLFGLKIYFDCGTEDDYGFEHGAEALNGILKSRGIPHEFHLYPGRHDWEYFAARLPAVMEFHSRAFGLTGAK